MVKSFSKGRDPSGAITAFLDTKGVFGPRQENLVAIPWVKVWESWDAMLQDPWNQAGDITHPRHAVSNMVKLVSYNSWFMTGPIPQEELDAGYPQGMPWYIRHTTGIPFAYVKQLMRLRTGAHHLAIETGRWSRAVIPRQRRTCSKCSQTVVEDELHLLFECPAYERIREKFENVLFSKFGGCRQATSTMRNDVAKARQFMDQEPSYQAAKFVFDCLEFRRSEECNDWNPYFDMSLFGEAEWQGHVFDTLSSGLRGVNDESLTSSSSDSSISAHGA
jgi:hypothetical protein